MKKLITTIALVLSISAVAQSYNCKSTDREYYDFDFTIKVDGNFSELTNNNTGDVDYCEARIEEDEVQIIECEGIGIAIANEQIDIEGGNALYQLSTGARGFFKCK